MKDDAAGGITPELLLRAYASGVFPMAESADAEALFWVDPERRGILPLDGLRVSRRLARSFRGGDFAIRVDADFAGVVDACADRPETWINPTIRRALPRAAPARPGALGRDLAGRTGWPAGSTASRSAPPSSARACSAAPATPRSSR